MPEQASLTINNSDLAVVGATCPVCSHLITESDKCQVCPDCGIPHHLDCWKYAQGCSIFGCRKDLRRHSKELPIERFTLEKDDLIKCKRFRWVLLVHFYTFLIMRMASISFSLVLTTGMTLNFFIHTFYPNKFFIDWWLFSSILVLFIGLIAAILYLGLFPLLKVAKLHFYKMYLALLSQENSDGKEIAKFVDIPNSFALNHLIQSIANVWSKGLVVGAVGIMIFIVIKGELSTSSIYGFIPIVLLLAVNRLIALGYSNNALEYHLAWSQKFQERLYSLSNRTSLEHKET